MESKKTLKKTLKNSTTTVRLNTETYESLCSLKKKIKYKSHDSLIKKMVSFFIKNAINPESSLNINLQSTINKFNDDFIKRDDSLRKWFGMIYHKEISILLFDQKKVLAKIESLHDYLITNEANKLTSEFIETFVKDNQKKEAEEKDLNKRLNPDNDLKRLLEENKLRDDVIEEKEIKLNDYKSKFKYLANKAEKGIAKNGNDIYTIVLTATEYRTITNL